MIRPDQLIHDLTALGNEFHLSSGILEMDNVRDQELASHSILSGAIENSHYHNPWFIPAFVRFGYAAWANALKEEKVARWIGMCTDGYVKKKDPGIVGIIMAGNIPLAGLHDLICVLASGHQALIKLSSTDDQLIPAVIKALCHIDPEFKERIKISEGIMRDFNAIIATGSNNSSRYFDYYFGKYPHVIRKNRNGTAVLTGHETEGELKKLADDIFVYFGLGCRNVSKLYIPEGFVIEKIFPYFSGYSFFSDMHKYLNNYDYQKSILLINRIPHYDNGFLLVKEDPSLMSPVSVLHTETYSSFNSLTHHLDEQKENIQCIISTNKEIKGALAPGCSQFPELWDYADGVDTMDFLTDLGKIR